MDLEASGATHYYARVREEEAREAGGATDDAINRAFERLHDGLTWPYLVRRTTLVDRRIPKFRIYFTQTKQVVWSSEGKRGGAGDDRGMVLLSVALRNAFFQGIAPGAEPAGFTEHIRKNVRAANERATGA